MLELGVHPERRLQRPSSGTVLRRRQLGAAPAPQYMPHQWRRTLAQPLTPAEPVPSRCSCAPEQRRQTTAVPAGTPRRRLSPPDTDGDPGAGNGRGRRERKGICAQQQEHARDNSGVGRLWQSRGGDCFRRGSSSSSSSSRVSLRSVMPSVKNHDVLKNRKHKGNMRMRLPCGCQPRSFGAHLVNN